MSGKDAMIIESTFLNVPLMSLLRSFRNHDLDTLAKHLNEFVKKLTDLDIAHQLPEFTSSNLPPHKMGLLINNAAIPNNCHWQSFLHGLENNECYKSHDPDSICNSCNI